MDLPGTYSLYPKSLDERVITDLLYDQGAASYPDFVVVTVDASNLRRSLLLFSQLADLGLPAILALNLTDVAERHGVRIDLVALEVELGVPVVPLNARTGSGVAALKIVMAERLAAPPRQFWEPTETLLPLVRQIRYYFNLHNDYLALHYAQQFRHIGFLSADDRQYFAGADSPARIRTHRRASPGNHCPLRPHQRGAAGGRDRGADRATRTRQQPH